VTRPLGIASTAVSIAFLAAAFFLERVWLLGAIVLLFGLLWITAWVFSWKWMAGLGLAFVFLFAGFGLFYTYGSSFLGTFRNLDPVLLFGCLPFALAAWDLADFDTRVKFAAARDERRFLVGRHLILLLLLLGLGMALVWTVLNVELELSFELIVILMLFVSWGLGRLGSKLLRR
jgi:hypothetical protein